MYFCKCRRTVIAVRLKRRNFICKLTIDLTLMPMCGFIAQLVDHRTSNAEVMGSNPLNYFQDFIDREVYSLELVHVPLRGENKFGPRPQTEIQASFRGSFQNDHSCNF